MDHSTDGGRGDEGTRLPDPHPKGFILLTDDPTAIDRYWQALNHGTSRKQRRLNRRLYKGRLQTAQLLCWVHARDQRR